MTENTPERYQPVEEKDSIRAETTSDGRYIPYSGGIMTWFQNAGVLKCEAPNNYRFHEMVDAEAVRKKLFERWGGGENVSRRVDERHTPRRPISLLLTTESGNSVPCTAKDYSSHGLRLQLEGSEQDGYAKGDKIRVVIQDSPESGRNLFDISSQVMWARQVGKTQPTISLGIAFIELSVEKRQALLRYFKR
jgi:hypothetical protein